MTGQQLVVNPYRKNALSPTERRILELEEEAKELISKLDEQHFQGDINPLLREAVKKLLHEAGYEDLYHCKFTIGLGSEYLFHETRYYDCLNNGNALFIMDFRNGEPHISPEHYTHVVEPSFVLQGEDLISKIKPFRQNPQENFDDAHHEKEIQERVQVFKEADSRRYKNDNPKIMGSLVDAMRG